MADHKEEWPDASDLKLALEGCLCDAHRTLNRKFVRLNEAKDLLKFIKKTRVLLIELHHATQRTWNDEEMTVALGRLRTRFFDLAKESAETNQQRNFEGKKSA